MEEKQEIKKKNILVPILIGIAVILIGVGVFLLLSGKDNNSKQNNEENTEKQESTSVDVTKFEGIYANGEDKLYIRKSAENEFHYMISGSFEGTAVVNGETAKEKELFNENEYFEFKLVDDGIELTYNAPKDHEVAIATGLYKKVAEYSSDNIYKEAVGDPQYLSTRNNGIYKNENIELFVFQISENQVIVRSSNNTTEVNIDEVFEEKTNEINGEVNFVAKSFFDEDKNAFSMKIFDNSIEITVYEDVFGFDEEDKKLEGNYKFDRKITKEDILKEFYSNNY